MPQLPFFKYDGVFSPPVRVLVKESHAIFKSIPRTSNELPRPDVIAISRRYRSIVHECVGNLSRDVTNDYADQVKTFRELDIIWNLCEILLLDVSQTGALILQLKNWVKMHFDDLTPDQKVIMRSLDDGSYKFTMEDVDDTYWNLAHKLVIRGELKRTIQLLKSHHAYNANNQLQVVASMLERMPLSNQYIAHEFHNKWEHWSAWCKQERETGQFDNDPALLTIVKLLSQDKEVYKELVPICDSWYPLIIANLLFTDPCIKQTDLAELCRLCINLYKKFHPKNYSSKPGPDQFDEIVIAAFEYDLIQVLANCCAHIEDNWWFVTHFIDLLHCSDQLSIHEIAEANRLRESFLQDYASTLFDDEHLWPIGVSYLNSCSTFGTILLDTLMSRVYLDINDEDKVHSLLAIAKKHGLTVLSKSICLIMARKWAARTPRLTDDSLIVDKYKRTNEVKLPSPINLSKVLYWAIKSGDSAITTYISDQYLYYYCKTETFPDKTVFEGLTRSQLNDERLAFLAKYFEFKQMSQESQQDLAEAGNLMKALLASKIYPKFFAPKLLEDTKNLLVIRPQLIFTTAQTLDVMRSVEEVTKGGNLEDDVELRKNLVRNMARALVTPISQNE